MTQVEALAKYAARASFSDLSAESRKQLPVHILDPWPFPQACMPR
jgi:2-methylcitrate dehydratase